jgi:hypothetical protein
MLSRVGVTARVPLGNVDFPLEEPSTKLLQRPAAEFVFPVAELCLHFDETVCAFLDSS